MFNIKDKNDDNEIRKIIKVEDKAVEKINDFDIDEFLKLREIIHQRKTILSIYFGVPGSGKTTLAAWLTRKERKQNGIVYSNVPITGAYELDCKNDIGKKMICNGRVIIDEAGIEYNCREYKSFSPEARYFFKYHRHYQCAVDVFSQGWDDCDKVIRTLAQRIYIIRKCNLLPWFVIRRTIGKRIDIDENTKQIIDAYYWVPFSTKFIFSPPLWKTFNTISREQFPEKEWQKY